MPLPISVCLLFVCWCTGGLVPLALVSLGTLLCLLVNWAGTMIKSSGSEEEESLSRESGENGVARCGDLVFCLKVNDG